MRISHLVRITLITAFFLLFYRNITSAKRISLASYQKISVFTPSDSSTQDF